MIRATIQGIKGVISTTTYLKGDLIYRIPKPLLFHYQNSGIRQHNGFIDWMNHNENPNAEIQIYDFCIYANQSIFCGQEITLDFNKEIISFEEIHIKNRENININSNYLELDQEKFIA
tara:strand:+ start:173 stop:526 length:354 start_codon:yes stop_codon:yes gene_type:complete